MTSTGRLLLVLPFFLVLVLGCGSKGNPNAPAKVHGKVTYKGAPVTAGTIQFLPKAAGTYTASIMPDATYSATDLPTGEMTVTVDTESANPNKKQPSYGGKKQMMGPIPQGVKAGPAGEYVKIPPKYAKAQTSGLTATLNAGDNEKNFDLTD